MIQLERSHKKNERQQRSEKDYRVETYGSRPRERPKIRWEDQVRRDIMEGVNLGQE